MSLDSSSTSEQRAGRSGALFRWSRRLLVGFGVLTLVIWLITTNGLYFWFNVGSENRLRFEYGRVNWRNVQGGTSSGSAGLDGGADKVEWAFESRSSEGRRTTKIPLWAPFAGLVAIAGTMTLVRRSRLRALAAESSN